MRQYSQLVLLLAGQAVIGISNKSRRKFCRLTEGNEMSARHLVSRDTETLARHPQLEVGWKKSIICAHQNADSHGRPCFECAS